MAETARHFRASGAATRQKAGHSSRRLETLKATSERAKEARERAHQVFLSLIESPVTPQDFIEQVKWINPEIYDDVIAERAISDLCGYPLCPSTFTDTFGPRTYIIRSNNVYNITERRNYCSDVCYEASELVRGQLSTVPLYLRLGEDAELSSVSLPQLHTLTGRYGKLVDVTGGLLDQEDVKPKQESPFKSLNEIAQESLINWSENEVEREASEQRERSMLNQTSTEKLDVILEDEALKNDRKGRSDRKLWDSSDGFSCSGNVDDKTLLECNISTKIADKLGSEVDGSQELKHDKDSKNEKKATEDEAGAALVKDLNKLKIVSDEMQDTSETSVHRQEISDKNENESKLEQPNPLLPVFEVEKAMREWISFESLRCVLGDKYVRGMLEHIGATWDDYDTTAGLRLGMEARGKYIALCRKLDHEERVEDAEMREAEGDTILNCQPKHPLPDYESLQADAKRHEMKVVAFLGGQDQYQDLISEQDGKKGSQVETIPKVKGHSATSSVRQAKAKPHVTKGKENNKGSVEEEEENENCTLPFVDSYCQAAWRQQIVLEKLSAYVGKVVEVTELDFREVRQLVRKLVATLDLTSHNVSFSPCQWRLVAFIVLHLLKIRYPIIGMALDSEEIHLMQDTVLSVFGLDSGYWTRSVAFLTEIKHVINKNFVEKEVAHVQN